MVVSIIANIAYPLDGIQGYYNMYSNYELQLSLERTSPYYLYCEAASTLLNPNVRTIGITTQASVSGAIASYLSFDQSLLLVWPHLTVMLALTMAAFTVSYIALHASGNPRVKQKKRPFPAWSGNGRSNQR